MQTTSPIETPATKKRHKAVALTALVCLIVAGALVLLAAVLGSSPNANEVLRFVYEAGLPLQAGLVYAVWVATGVVALLLQGIYRAFKKGLQSVSTAHAEMHVPHL